MVLPIPVGASMAKERPNTTLAAQERCRGQGGAPFLASKKRAQSASVASPRQNRVSRPGAGDLSGSGWQTSQASPAKSRSEGMARPQLGQ